MAMADELRQALSQVQDYVDGTMPRREAVQFYLLAQRHPELAAEIESTKALFASLDTQPREEPGVRFDDAAILRSVPYERYRSAPLPLHMWPIVRRIPFLARWLQRTSRLALAAGAAYLLALASTHGILARSVGGMARSLDARLEGWVAQSREVPFVSSVVSMVAALYDGVMGVVVGLAELFGAPLVTLALGFALGAAVWSAAAAIRRRRQALRHLA